MTLKLYGCRGLTLHLGRFALVELKLHQWVILLYVAKKSGPGSLVEVNGIYLRGWVSVSVLVAASPQFAIVFDGNLFYLTSVRKSQTPLGLDFFI